MDLSKMRVLAVFLAAVWAPGSLEAQDAVAPRPNTPPPLQNPNPQPAPKLDDAALGKMFDAYATIAGGWYLEQRCNFLPKEYKAEFDWNVAQTNVALSRQAKPGFLPQLQQSARKVAEATTCNQEATTLIVTTLVKSRETTKFLTGQTYTPALGLAQEAQYVVALLVGQRLDDKCKIMPAEIRKEYDSRIADITMSFAKSAGDSAADRIKTNSAEVFQKSGGPCDKADGILKSGIALARQMSPKWKAN